MKLLPLHHGLQLYHEYQSIVKYFPGFIKNLLQTQPAIYVSSYPLVFLTQPIFFFPLLEVGHQGFPAKIANSL